MYENRVLSWQNGTLRRTLCNALPSPCFAPSAPIWGRVLMHQELRARTLIIKDSPSACSPLALQAEDIVVWRKTIGRVACSAKGLQAKDGEKRRIYYEVEGKNSASYARERSKLLHKYIENLLCFSFSFD